MRTEHEKLCFEDSFVAKRKVNRHLVTVEVGVECRTCERMELDSLTFDHLGLECLNTETVKSRGSVEEHGVALHHIFEDIPNDRLFAVDDLLGRLDSLYNATLNELAYYEGLVELGSHIFGDTAFVHLKFRTYDDNRTSRIVDTLTEKVLTETALLTLERVRERFEGGGLPRS